jgi:hypothetical protein
MSGAAIIRFQRETNALTRLKAGGRVAGQSAVPHRERDGC